MLGPTTLIFFCNIESNRHNRKVENDAPWSPITIFPFFSEPLQIPHVAGSPYDTCFVCLFVFVLTHIFFNKNYQICGKLSVRLSTKLSLWIFYCSWDLLLWYNKRKPSAVIHQNANLPPVLILSPNTADVWRFNFDFCTCEHRTSSNILFLQPSVESSEEKQTASHKSFSSNQSCLISALCSCYDSG